MDFNRNQYLVNISDFSHVYNRFASIISRKKQGISTKKKNKKMTTSLHQLGNLETAYDVDDRGGL